MNDETSLRTAIVRNNYRKVERILRQNPPADLKESLRWASLRGYLPIVRLLLASGADPSADNSSALVHALPYLDVVKLLVDDPRVNPASNDNFPLLYACLGGHVETVKFLLDLPLDRGVELSNRAVSCAHRNNQLRGILVADQQFRAILGGQPIAIARLSTDPTPLLEMYQSKTYWCHEILSRMKQIDASYLADCHCSVAEALTGEASLKRQVMLRLILDPSILLPTS